MCALLEIVRDCWMSDFRILGFREIGFSILEFRKLGFRILGFRELGFRILGFKESRL